MGLGLDVKNRVLINASNLHAGGGIQVAISFIEELSFIKSDVVEFHVVCSSEVDQGLGLFLERSAFSSYTVVDVYGIEACLPRFSKRLRNYDVVFTIFGPDYRLMERKNGVVGFAQPWIVYPDNEIYDAMGFFSKIKSRIKFFIQKCFFMRSLRLVVELPHVKEKLVESSIFCHDKIDVVFNSVSSVYFRPERWKKIKMNVETNAFKIGFVTRDYPHKNLKVLPEIKSILNEKYQLDVEFFVTLREDEWSSKTEIFRESINMVGELSVYQCPSFYEEMDAVIFPSLLECFSAAPLEAMIMERPLFASDRSFVRDVCRDYAYYFDPLEPASGAESIARYFFNIRGHDQESIAQAKAHAVNFSSARGRAEQYVRILEKEVALPNYQ